MFLEKTPFVSCHSILSNVYSYEISGVLYGGPGGRERTLYTCAFHVYGFVVIIERTSTVSGYNK